MYTAKEITEKRQSSFLFRLGKTPIAEKITGPMALKKDVFRWKSTLRDLWDELVLLPPHMIYPFSWHTPGELGGICSAMTTNLNESLCQEKLSVEEKGSLSITYWSMTHKGTGYRDSSLESINQE